MFSLIVCTDNRGGIAKNGTTPYYNKVDLANFKRLTTNNVIIMGSTTWFSLPKRPLPNRLNVVLSRTGQHGDLSFSNIYQCIEYFSKKKNHQGRELFVIGGKQIYDAFDPYIGKLYLTSSKEDNNCDLVIKYTSMSLRPYSTPDNPFYPLYFNKFGDDKDEKVQEYFSLRRQFEDQQLVYQEGLFRNTEEEAFIRQLYHILENGKERIDRTGVGIIGVFGVDMRFDISTHFPLMTTRQVSLKMIFEELMWFLRGQTDVKILESKKVPVWTPNSTREFLDLQGLQHYREGDVGKSYGFQFRHYGADYFDCETDYTGKGFDQLAYVIDLIKNDPTSRRIIINLWNPLDLNKTALPCCGFCYQFYVDDGYLSCKVTQRSSDISLAGSWNVASASLFVYLLADICGLKPKEVIWSVGDCHIYKNQIEAVKEQLKRIPRRFPVLKIVNSRENITDFEFTDLKLLGYNPYPRIKVAMNA